MAHRIEEHLTVDRKALILNLDERVYGTFAEIGAGQEVARNFFRAGGASGTVAKTMSAYDMKFSDEIYGKVGRYVSRARLGTMLDHEYRLLIERLSKDRGDRTTFFVFADTVATVAFKGKSDPHGWLGIRFQAHPMQQPNDIIIHVRMWDREAVLQQQALGVIGANLIFGAFYFADEPEILIASLLDELSTDRIEVDMIEFRGPSFERIDNRIMSLKLVQKRLTDAAMFGADGTVLQPSEVLRKKSVLIQRGSFRPVTKVATDMLESSRALFRTESSVIEDLQNDQCVEILEITLNNLLSVGSEFDSDFLARADVLSTLGYPVLISNFSEYFRLVAYLRRYTERMIAMPLGVRTLLEVFNEKYYQNLPGGILEGFGRMFKNEVKLYLYPTKVGPLKRYAHSSELIVDDLPEDEEAIIDSSNIPIPKNLKYLYRHLLENHAIQDLKGYNESYLGIAASDTVKLIEENDPSWREMVPEPAVRLIEERKLWAKSD